MSSTPMPDVGIKTNDLLEQSKVTSRAFWGRRQAPPQPVITMPTGPQPYPKMMYHPDPAARVKYGLPFCQVAHDEEEHRLALDNGWTEEASIVHREMLQAGDNGRSGNRLPVAGSEELMDPKPQPLSWDNPKQEPEPEPEVKTQRKAKQC